jgi:hypothetical protein
MLDYSHKYQHREKRYIVLYSIPKKFDLSKTSVLLCFKPFRIWCFNMNPKKKKIESFYSFYFNIVLVALHYIWDKEKRGSKLGSDNFPLIERLPLSATWGRTLQLYWLNAARSFTVHRYISEPGTLHIFPILLHTLLFNYVKI